MKLLTSQEDFIEKLEQYKKDSEVAVRNYEEHNLFQADSERTEGLTIQGQVFSGIHLYNAIFDKLRFKDCTFKKCSFSEMRATNVSFENCKFLESRIDEFEFLEGFIENSEFEDCTGESFILFNSDLFNISFTKCNLSSFYFGNNYCIHVVFGKSTISNTIFESDFLSGEPSEFCFVNSILSDCSYKYENLKGSLFENCKFEGNSFSNCLLSANTFLSNNNCEDGQYSSIDLHTIVNSEELTQLVLNDVFGVNDSKIKKVVFDLTAELKRPKRKAIPYKTRARLQKEINSKCPFCSNEDVEHFDVHHIDGDPSNDEYDNLIMLCKNDHSKITKRYISREDVIKKKQYLLAKRNTPYASEGLSNLPS